MFDMSTSRYTSLNFKVALVILDLAAVEPEKELGTKFQQRLTVFPGKRCALINSLEYCAAIVRFHRRLAGNEFLKSVVVRRFRRKYVSFNFVDALASRVCIGVLETSA